MARKAELKKQRVFNTGNGVAKPVWNNANRVNHANHFVPRPVQLIAVRQNVNSVRPNVNTGRANVNSVRQNVNFVRSNVNTGSFNINIVKAKQPIHTSNSNSFSPVRPQVNKFNQRSNFSKSHSPVRRPIVRNTAKMSYTHAVKGNWGTAVKTSAGYNWRKTRPNSNCNSGSNFIRTDHPLKNMEDRGIFDSGCSGHMTGNKDHLDDFEECKGGSVTFGELHQFETFYNALNANESRIHYSAAGGNFLDNIPRECLRIIKSKSKVRNSQNKAVVAKVSSNSSTSRISLDVAALTTEVPKLKNMMKTVLIDKQKAQAPAPVKASSKRPTIPTSSPRVVERRTEVTKDTIFPTNKGITKDVQPPVVPVEKQNPVSKPDVAPVSAPMPNPKPSIPYPSRRNDEKRRENADEQKEKIIMNRLKISF
ncbi:hypothetical protein Tco_1517000 [Tanacetum coccineum]